MKRLEIQKLLSIDGYWTINKHLARTYGFHATALLQQLIELQCEFFPKGDFYQQQDELANKLGISEKVLVSARKKLTAGVLEKDDDGNIIKQAPAVLIARRGYGAKYYYTVLLDNITKLFEVEEKEAEENETLELEESESSDVTKGNIPKLQNGAANRKKRKQKEIIQKEVLDETSDDNPDKDFYGKIFFRIVDAYPTNRVNNRQNGLEKFNMLTKEEAKLAASNLKRYLTATGTYVKSLLNYIDQKCFTEEWLSAQEKLNRKSKDKSSTAHNFTGKY